MKERVKKDSRNQGQTLIGIIIVLIIVALFSGGLYYYISKKTPEIPQNAQKSNEEATKSPDVIPSPEEEPTPSPEEKKPVIQKCSDGTLYNQCSTNKPKYCDNGNLIDQCVTCNCPLNKVCQINGSCETVINCQNECTQMGSSKCSNNGYQTCGNYNVDNCLEWSPINNCPLNTVCQNGSCVPQKCSDGTLYSQCSTNKPKYCDKGILVDKCSICSCAIGTICENNKCIQATDIPGPTPLSGALNLLLDTSYPNQSVTAPQSKFKLAEFSLTNNTTETINLKTIEVDLATNSDFYLTNIYVRNLYIVYGSNKSNIFNSIAYKNYFYIKFQLLVGQTIDLSVYGDVNSSIPLNSIIRSNILVTGVTAISTATVYTNSNTVLSGQNIIFVKGSLVVVQDSSTPPSKIVAANQIVDAGKFKFTAIGDSYTISELKFIIPSPGVILTISDVVLSDTITQDLFVSKPVLVSGNDSDYVLDFNVNISVSLSSSKSITLYYNLKSDINPDGADTNIKPILIYVKATNDRGVLMDGAAADYKNIIVASDNSIKLPTSGVTFNDIYIFKSTPIFTTASSNTSALNGSNIDLYTFNIGADPNGDIAIKQLTFTITITNKNDRYPHLNNFAFLKGNSDYANLVAIQTFEDNNYIGLASNVSIWPGENTVIVSFYKHEIIPAGKTQTYTLKAYANSFFTSSKGTDSITTFIPSDTTKSNSGSYLRMISFSNVYGLSPTSQDISVIKYNLLWSDQSGLNVYSSENWYNGFKVLNLPLSKQTVNVK